MGGMTTNMAKMPTIPRIKAMIQVICLGALSFIISSYKVYAETVSSMALLALRQIAG